MSRANRRKQKMRKPSFIPIIIILIVLGAIATTIYFKSRVNNLSSNPNALNNVSNATNNSSVAANNSSSTTTIKNSTNTSTNTTSNTSNNETNGYSVSISKATDILNSKINKGTTKTKLNYDHIQERDSEKYYTFSATMPSTDAQSSNTIGWYYVNVNTGEAFSWDLVDNTLTPLK